MKPRHLFLALVSLLPLLAAGVASAQTLTRGPLIQNPAGLTTTMTLVWWTDVSGNSTVEYGTTPSLGSSIAVPTAGSCEIGAAGTCHVVPLTGLTAGTRYYYRLLTNGVQVKATTYFQTFPAPSDPDDLFFTVVGDFGSGQSQASTVASNQDAVDPPLVVTVGDNAYENGTLSDWDNNVFIPQYDTLLSRAVFIPTLGNHDVNNVGASNWATSAEIRLHHLPRNATPGDEERYFSFDYGDAHFIVLDSNPPAINATQAAWLEADLAATTRKWIFVFHHIASHSCANGIASFGSNMTVRNAWGHLFEEYGVDVVFEGHDHIYERSKAVDEYVVGGGAGADGLKTIYIMSGGGGKTLDGAANSDAGGPYRQPLFGSKSYCPWIANDCPNGVGGQYCSFARYQHTEVRIENDDTLIVTAVDQNDQIFDTLTITKGVTCGDGVPQAGEQCDQGAANGTTASCCSATCTLKSSGTTCRASAGVCDLTEACTGSSAQCPTDLKSTAECRGLAGACDVAESCDGVSNTCPADATVAAGTTCRSTAGSCDVAEACDGSNTQCPTDALVSGGTECRGASGVCDVAESCTGVSPTCPNDGFVGAGIECRAASDLCDLAEACTGSSGACPADVLKPGGSSCRASTGVCDPAETCSGASAACPANVLTPAGTTCRGAASVCDVAESCTGSSGACPADVVAPGGTECRASAGVCDVAETCTGSSPLCPANAFQPGTVECRASTAECDAAESCTGSSAACPGDVLSPPSTVCRASTAPCDAAESCTGSSSACPTDAIASAGTTCRASAGTCDVVETCDGTSTACPPDGFAAASSVCRPALGVCDVPESCTGSGAQCPSNGFLGTSSVCRPAIGACDVAEVCSGSTATCPPNGIAGAGTACRGAADVCDVAETCNGVTTTCPADALQPSSVVCRPSTGVCDVAESCNGSSVACPADTGLPDGDGDGVCDLDDECPVTQDPGQADTDGDGLGDACDPCSNFLSVSMTKPSLVLSKLATPPGDDKLKLAGSMTVPASPNIDPLSNDGVRLILQDLLDAPVLDVTIPGGQYDPLTRVGWTVNPAGTTYTYRNAGTAVPLIAGINKVLIKKNTRTPGLVTFSVTAKNGSYPVGASSLPLFATLILDPPFAANNQCGEVDFAAPGRICTFAAGPGVARCK